MQNMKQLQIIKHDVKIGWRTTGTNKMTLQQKEQTCFCMIEGCLVEPWYEKWFVIAMESMFKDPNDRADWKEELRVRKEAKKYMTQEVK